VFQLQVQQIESGISLANVGAEPIFLTGLRVGGRAALASWLFIGTASTVFMSTTPTLSHRQLRLHVI